MSDANKTNYPMVNSKDFKVMNMIKNMMHGEFIKSFYPMIVGTQMNEGIPLVGVRTNLRRYQVTAALFVPKVKVHSNKQWTFDCVVPLGTDQLRTNQIRCSQSEQNLKYHVTREANIVKKKYVNRLGELRLWLVSESSIFKETPSGSTSLSAAIANSAKVRLQVTDCVLDGDASSSANESIRASMVLMTTDLD
ncbi:uncharacterized protein G2W53_033885 [Senna tora]|uniref:Uncharacterized protein n=1 Tax=Senna tora TaxID=362788 RepID=A0A834TA68_9FABA|nr:uncharacterized protein G2W53_033885 [Senna tora]